MNRRAGSGHNSNNPHAVRSLGLLPLSSHTVKAHILKGSRYNQTNNFLLFHHENFKVN